MNKKFIVFLILTKGLCVFSQNVGIGTTNPQSKLHVTGTAMADTIKINNYSNTATQPAYINANGILVTQISPTTNNSFINNTDTNVPFNACTPTTMTIAVSGMPTAVFSKFIKVKIRITNATLSNLAVTLTRIVGSTTEVIVLYRNGAVSGSSLDNITFTDDAMQTITSNPPSNSTFKPHGIVSGSCMSSSTNPRFEDLFNGVVNPNGNWFLNVSNFVSGSPSIAVIDFAEITFGTNPNEIAKENFIPKWKTGVLTDSSSIFDNGNVGIGLKTPSAKLHLNGAMKIDASNTLEFGAGLTKENNAGKIGYATFTPGALDIVGAGTTSTLRKIKMFSEGGLEIMGNIKTNDTLFTDALRLTNGSQGANKVLVSDALGNANWQANPIMYIATLEGSNSQNVPLNSSAFDIVYLNEVLDPDNLIPCSTFPCNFTTFVTPATGYYQMNVSITIGETDLKPYNNSGNIVPFLNIVAGSTVHKEYAQTNQRMSTISFTKLIYLTAGQAVKTQGGDFQCGSACPTIIIHNARWEIKRIR